MAADDRSLDGIFAALADPTRRRVLHRLRAGPASVGEIAAPIEMSLPAVSKHLRVLEKAGLVRRERRGRTHRMHLEAAPLADVQAFIERYRPFWQDNLDALARYLEDDPAS